MKYLKRIFESKENIESYIEECFFEVSENINFEVDDLYFEDYTSFTICKLHIEEGKNIKIEASSGTRQEWSASNFIIGKMKVDLDFLKMRLDKISELINDIEIAIDRVKDKFENSMISIEINKIGYIDITIKIEKYGKTTSKNN
jgi:hypothetical protein